MTILDTSLSLHEMLFTMQDTTYKAFHAGLIPNIAPERIIGIRTPALRRFAAKFARSPLAADFLQTLPHTYYEENNLHAFLIEKMPDYSQTVAALDAFLPFVDNWATCDMMSPAVFKKHRSELIGEIRRWIQSDHAYTVRFGLEMLMKYFLDNAFREEYLALAASVKSDEYYVNMMIAWFFATALAKQYDATVPYLENQCLDVWIHNKTIQKARESLRIISEQKAYLSTLKRKEAF